MLTSRQFLEQRIWTASYRHGFSNNSYASAIISPSLSSFITLISHTFTSNASIVSRTVVFYAFRYAISLQSPDRTTTARLCKPSTFVRHFEYVARHCCQHVRPGSLETATLGH